MWGHILTRSVLFDLRARSLFVGWDDHIYWNAANLLLPISIFVEWNREKLIWKALVHVKKDDRLEGGNWTKLHLSSNVRSPASSLPGEHFQHLETWRPNPFTIQLLDAPSICVADNWLGGCFAEHVPTPTAELFRNQAGNLSMCAIHENA